MNIHRHELIWNTLYGVMGGISMVLSVASFAAGENFWGAMLALGACMVLGTALYIIIDCEEET